MLVIELKGAVAEWLKEQSEKNFRSVEGELNFILEGRRQRFIASEERKKARAELEGRSHYLPVVGGCCGAV